MDWNNPPRMCYRKWTQIPEETPLQYFAMLTDLEKTKPYGAFKNYIGWILNCLVILSSLHFRFRYIRWCIHLPGKDCFIPQLAWANMRKTANFCSTGPPERNPQVIVWFPSQNVMGFLPDTQNCGLRMRRECRERFPCHRGLAIPTCITASAWRTCRDACRDR